MRWCAMIALALSCAACNQQQSLHVVPAAKPGEQAALLGRVKELAGTWELTGEDGKKEKVVYQVASHGTAVREVMFPGSEHEMTNMYTMDGPNLLMTHYCAMGNQPHMRASASSGDRITFKTQSVSNLTAADQSYMGELTIVFVDHDHIKQEWQSLKNGKPLEHHASFSLTRVN